MASVRYGIDANLVFQWRRHRDDGSLLALTAGEAVVAESEVVKLKEQLEELQRMRGQRPKTSGFFVPRLRSREKKLLSPALLSKLEASL